jgi:Family of unknown function (DUF5519)
MNPLTLPTRRGDRPRTTPSNPHEQLEGNAPPALQEALWKRMAALPGVQTGHSHIAPAGSRALRLSGGGRGVAAFMIGSEFAHLHPAYDGSLHLTLDPATHTAAIAAGWAERHPLAGRFAPETTVMVYGPRDAAELETVFALVEQSLRYARGDIDVE